MDISFVIAIILYVTLIIGFILWAIKNFKKKRMPSVPPEENNIIMNKCPVFRSIGHYMWPIWFSVFFGFFSFVIATNQLHDIEFREYLGAILFMLGPFSLFFMFLMYGIFRLIAYIRKEKHLSSSHIMKLYVVGILVSLVIYMVFQERDPLHKYGLEFEWYDPPGSSGSFYVVSIHRRINGQTIKGAECGGGYPRITFSDEDDDGIEDIIVHADNQELAVLSLVEPYVEGKSVFTVIREADKGDFGCWYR
jgi:hypothetical protein